MKRSEKALQDGSQVLLSIYGPKKSIYKKETLVVGVTRIKSRSQERMGLFERFSRFMTLLTHIGHLNFSFSLNYQLKFIFMF